MNNRIKRLAAGVLIASLVSTANAELITPTARGDRERIAAHLDREDVAAELASQGITKDQAKARVAALTDAEAATLAGRVDELPAGGFVQIIAVMAMAGAAAIPILIGAIVLGAAAIVGGITLIAKAASKDSAPTATARTETKREQPAAAKVLTADSGGSSPFPVSTGLYGAFVPAARAY